MHEIYTFIYIYVICLYILYIIIAYGCNAFMEKDVHLFNICIIEMHYNSNCESLLGNLFIVLFLFVKYKNAVDRLQYSQIALFSQSIGLSVIRLLISVFTQIL